MNSLGARYDSLPPRRRRAPLFRALNAAVAFAMLFLGGVLDMVKR